MSKELGTLAVVVLKAKNLYDRHSFYKQDPYAKITLNGKTFKTDTDAKGGQHPEWDAEFRFTVYGAKNDSSRMLEVTCWRAEPRGDEEIGKGKVDIGDTLKTGEFDDWVTINDVSGTYRGEIYLEMTFFASEPPKLGRRPSKLPPQERLQHLKKPSAAPVAGGNLTVPGGAQAYEPPKMDKPLPSVHESPGPAPLPPTLRPGTGTGPVNGQGHRQSEYTPPINSPPPSSLFPGRPLTSPLQQPSNSSSFSIPGHHSRPSLSNGYDFSQPPPHPGHSPPRLSHSPPRQNPYLSEPPPPRDSRPSFFPSPNIVVDSTPPAPSPYNYNTSNDGSGYSSPQRNSPRHSPPQLPPPSISTGAPSFPSVSAQRPPPNFYPPQPTSSPYPPPESNYPPSQPGYPQPQSAYSPPSQPGYPVPGPPQFPSHYPTFHVQPQYTTYGHIPPPTGPGQRPFFVREDSVDEFPDPALAQRYSSPLPLPSKKKPPRGSSPFPVPTISPPQHPVPNTYSPNAEYERENQWRREQEERDEEIARRLDLELNLGG